MKGRMEGEGREGGRLAMLLVKVQLRSDNEADRSKHSTMDTYTSEIDVLH